MKNQFIKPINDPQTIQKVMNGVVAGCDECQGIKRDANGMIIDMGGHA